MKKYIFVIRYFGLGTLEPTINSIISDRKFLDSMDVVLLMPKQRYEYTEKELTGVKLVAKYVSADLLFGADDYEDETKIIINLDEGDIVHELMLTYLNEYFKDNPEKNLVPRILYDKLVMRMISDSPPANEDNTDSDFKENLDKEQSAEPFDFISIVNEDNPTKIVSDEFRASLKTLEYDEIKHTKELSFWQKMYVLSLKYGSPSVVFGRKDSSLGYEFGYLLGNKIFEEFPFNIRISKIAEANGNLEIAGHCHFPDEEHFTIIAIYNGKEYLSKQVFQNPEYIFGETVHRECFFDLEIPVATDGKIEFYFKVVNYGYFLANIAFDVDCRLKSKLSSFALYKNVLLSLSEKPNAIEVSSITESDGLNIVMKSISKALGKSKPSGVLESYISLYRILSDKRIYLYVDCEPNDCLSDDIMLVTVTFGTNEHKLYSLFAEKIIISDNAKDPFEGEKYRTILSSLSRGAEYETIA